MNQAWLEENVVLELRRVKYRKELIEFVVRRISDLNLQWGNEKLDIKNTLMRDYKVFCNNMSYGYKYLKNDLHLLNVEYPDKVGYLLKKIEDILQDNMFMSESEIWQYLSKYLDSSIDNLSNGVVIIDPVYLLSDNDKQEYLDKLKRVGEKSVKIQDFFSSYQKILIHETLEKAWHGVCFGYNGTLYGNIHTESGYISIVSADEVERYADDSMAVLNENLYVYIADFNGGAEISILEKSDRKNTLDNKVLVNASDFAFQILGNSAVHGFVVESKGLLGRKGW